MSSSLETPTLESPSASTRSMAFDAAATAAGVRRAQRHLGAAPPEARTAVLHRLSGLLEAREEEILDANRRDLEAAREAELAGPLLKRLGLSADKLATLRQGVAGLSERPDPIGAVLRRTELDQGLVLEQVQSPLGVLLIIFESRPDAVIQIGSLAVRSGNGVILKGGSEASESNRVLVACLRDALAAEGLPADAVFGVEGRSAVADLLEQDAHIDLVIPRGSGELVKRIQSTTRIPVLGHAEGICHLYLDSAAAPAMAAALAVDGKCAYPAACNATETLLVHREFLPHLPAVARALAAEGVSFVADHESGSVLRSRGIGAELATESTWRTEYGDLVLSIRVVEGLESAVEHIHRHGSAHTDAIVTEDAATAEAFLGRVDSASVFWNASTRFADGFRYGLGAEVGIATGRIHARGPVGVEGLLTTRWLLRGSGQIAGEYGPGKRAFTHRRMPPAGV
ncbi:MAG: glutamate-5-semialdehyde dehydrogenase [Holophagales bacterium]|nr:glutamate-5-semialdehyde dehydrogenase [Holophagales bacterium]